MPNDTLQRFVTLPDLRFVNATRRRKPAGFEVHTEKVSAFEVCPRCATPSASTYDHRVVRVKDAPLRDQHVVLHIRKRRLWCRPCRKPFTEPVAGIRKGHRTTERYQRSLLSAAETFSDLTQVRRAYACSAGSLYTMLYHQLELRRRTRIYPWPEHLGLDEHFFRREKTGERRFASVITDIRNHRVMELVDGRRSIDLEMALAHIEGRERVRAVVTDLAEPYRTFAKTFFPNALRVADKFHVVRLLHPAINRRRKEITGDKRLLPVRRLLLQRGKTLPHLYQRVLREWLSDYPELREIYETKERMHAFYRIRSHAQASLVFTDMTDRMALSVLPEIKTLRRTLLAWRTEILNYFRTRLTNAMTEGFNNKAKLVQRRAFGYKSFRNYRLRLLNVCA